MANSGPSILAASRSKKSLIIVFVLVRRGRRRLVRPAGQRRELRRLVGALAELRRRLRRLVDALSEQIVVEHLARDRRRRARSKAGVLNQHGERDPRIFLRREGDEERVVAQMLGNRRVGVFLVLLERDDLGG